MTEQLRLGYVPLIDAAPLLIAQRMGFAREEGLSLDLMPAPGWAALRDMLALGQIEAAHMLSAMPIAMALGLGGGAARFEALSVLNANGDVIGVSNRLAARMRDAHYTFDFTDARAAGLAMLAASQDSLRIGIPFPFSMHAELVHYWLEGLGVPLPKLLDIVTIPPARMAEALADDAIDAFCVGEPHGSATVEQAVGALLLPGVAIWAFSPEKVLAARAGWAEEAPETAGRLMRSIWRSGRWLGQPKNRMMASEILAGAGLGRSAEAIERILNGRLTINSEGDERQVPGFVEFHAGAATFPWRSQAAWIGQRLAKRFGLDVAQSIATARGVFRSDLHRLHLAPTGADLPGASEKLEGSLSAPTPVSSARGRLILPSDCFFDAQIFDPSAQQ
ncbi:MAG: NitT/TauT family transport system ATP-binding protein [Pseudorhodobacter sp.]|jgi:NitT/TauT family transport system ATP-binding protein